MSRGSSVVTTSRTGSRSATAAARVYAEGRHCRRHSLRPRSLTTGTEPKKEAARAPPQAGWSCTARVGPKPHSPSARCLHEWQPRRASKLPAPSMRSVGCRLDLPGQPALELWRTLHSLVFCRLWATTSAYVTSVASLLVTASTSTSPTLQAHRAEERHATQTFRCAAHGAGPSPVALDACRHGRAGGGGRAGQSCTLMQHPHAAPTCGPACGGWAPAPVPGRGIHSQACAACGAPGTTAAGGGPAAGE